MEYKGYNVVPMPEGSNLAIKPRGSGSIPKNLYGQYTSRLEAHKAIDRHLASLIKGKKPDGKTKSPSTA